MKKLLLLFVLAAGSLNFAALPKSIEIQSGKIFVRLAAEKCWNINGVKWDSNMMGIDAPKSHYGMAFQPQGSRFFIGSGHGESGKSEELVSLKIKVDGKEITPVQGNLISGKTIDVVKTSYIADFIVNYSFRIANDRLDEKIVIRAKNLVKVNFLYCFMHPWSTRFTDFLLMETDGSFKVLKFKSDGNSPARKKFPAGAWYDPKSGLAVVTVTRFEKGERNAFREVWDRSMYRKDYLVPYSRAYFRVDNELRASASTAFFCEKDADKWQKTAKEIAEKLK
ncbi:MAG: hypothetical protein IKC65_00745 [Lentisphaeria bacterium]|nr:hypothetical protein [Lentisphaeria bacterium]